MTGAIRPFVLGLALTATLARVSWGSDESQPQAGPKPDPGRPTSPLEEPLPPPFVALHPRTVERQAQIDAIRLYSAARALEDQRLLPDAIRLLEEADRKDPGSIAIARRLSILNFALGRTDQAVGYSRRVIEAEPEDTTTIRLLVAHHLKKRDPAGAVTLLEGLLANPKLDKTSPGFLLIERDLGMIYAESLQQEDKAADAFAKVVEALDDKAANRLTLAEQKSILGDEAESYQKFGEVFYNARRYDLAVKAFKRGLVYDPDNSQLPLLLAEALLKAGKSAEALETVESVLKGPSSGLEAFELLAQALTSLKRGDEVIPRFEAAIKADPKNASLQFALAERYRIAGKVEKADALYKAMLASQDDPQGFGSLSESLRKEKKTAELLKLCQNEFGKRNGAETVKPQIESIINDSDYVDEVLDTGLRMLKEDPPGLDKVGRTLLVYIATKAKKTEKLIALSRLAVEQDPTPQAYRELWTTLFQHGQYAEAAATLNELIEKFPAEKNPQVLYGLAQSQMLTGKNEEALATAREALKIAPDYPPALRIVGFALSRLGRNEEAIAHYKDWLARSGDDDDVARIAHAGLSNVYVNMEEFDKGEAELEALLAKEPDDAGTNNDLGYLYAERGKNLERAEAMIRKAIAEDPENSAYLDSLGWVLFKRGKVEEALVPLEKAAAEASSDPTVFDHLGDVYHRLQRPAKAKAAWERAAAIAAKSVPPDKRLPEIRKKLESLGKLVPDPQPSSGETP